MTIDFMNAIFLAFFFDLTSFVVLGMFFHILTW